MLIKQNKAALAEKGADIEAALRWFTEKNKPEPVQKVLFSQLNEQEKRILSYLSEEGETALDHLSLSLDIPVAKLSASLLNLEFNGLVKPLPGKYYRKN
jgi:DNA processing protein